MVGRRRYLKKLLSHSGRCELIITGLITLLAANNLEMRKRGGVYSRRPEKLARLPVVAGDTGRLPSGAPYLGP